MPRVIVGLGSNLYPRLTHLTNALRLLDGCLYLRIHATASLYESEPWGGVADRTFLNSAVLLSTSLSPHSLLSLLKSLERRAGREPTNRWGNREIDMDILLYDNLAYHSPSLTIPHPYFLQRPFAFLPTQELWGEYIHPQTGKPLKAMTREDAWPGTKKVSLTVPWHALGHPDLPPNDPRGVPS